MSAAKDNTGAWLDGGKSYRLRVPANVPVKEFWSGTVYDNLTRSMIQTDTNKAALSSYDKLKTNPDGSIDLYFGPQVPQGDETNWVKTAPGKGWFTYFRWYSPTQAFFDKHGSYRTISLLQSDYGDGRRLKLAQQGKDWTQPYSNIVVNLMDALRKSIGSEAQVGRLRRSPLPVRRPRRRRESAL
jgi:hypothetical protein